jgi:hypothetical protein
MKKKCRGEREGQCKDEGEVEEEEEESRQRCFIKGRPYG